MMDKAPEAITVCLLDVVVMPNGEVICDGRSLGWVGKGGKGLGKNLRPLTEIVAVLDDCEQTLLRLPDVQGAWRVSVLKEVRDLRGALTGRQP